MKFERIVIQLR